MYHVSLMDPSSTSIKPAYMKWLRLNVAGFLKHHIDGKGRVSADIWVF